MKLRNKLILSCAALAAVATTAVSTTFAWYTANTDVNAKGLVASTESIDDATLLISLNNYDFGPSVDLTDIFKNKYLKPVQYEASSSYQEVALTADTYVTGNYYIRTGAGTDQSPYVYNLSSAAFSSTETYYYKVVDSRNASIKLWDQDTNAAGDDAVANRDYVRFTLFFKSASSTSINVKNMKFNIKNTTSEYTPKVKLASAGMPITAKSYTVDLFRALVVDVDVQNGHECDTEPANAEAGFTAGNFGKASHKTYSFNDMAGNDTVSEDGETGWNAHSYYNAVKLLNSYQKASDFVSATATAKGYFTKIANPYVAPQAQPTAENFGSGTYFIYEKGAYKLATAFDAATATASGYFVKGKDYTVEAVAAAAKPTSTDDILAGEYYTDQTGETRATTYDANATYYVRVPKAEVFTNEVQPTTVTFDQGVYYTWTDGIDETRLASETTQIAFDDVEDFKDDVLGNTGAGSSTQGEAQVVAVTYTIYLDGWDQFCFNGVQSQRITLDLEYQGSFQQ